MLLQVVKKVVQKGQMFTESMEKQRQKCPEGHNILEWVHHELGVYNCQSEYRGTSMIQSPVDHKIYITLKVHNLTIIKNIYKYFIRK